MFWDEKSAIIIFFRIYLHKYWVSYIKHEQNFSLLDTCSEKKPKFPRPSRVEKCLILSLGFTSQQHRPMNVNSSAMLLTLYLRISFQNQFRLHTLRFIYMFPDLRLVVANSFGEWHQGMSFLRKSWLWSSKLYFRFMLFLPSHLIALMKNGRL